MRFDFHIHTKYSYDSILEPKIIVKQALRKGIKALSITDHNTIKGSFAVLKESKQRGEKLLVVPGIEIKTNVCDIIGLFIQEEIKSRQIYEVVDNIKDQGGLVALPHPYSRGRKPSKELIAKIDLIEVFNGRATEHENRQALTLFEKTHKGITAGSDAHFAFELGKVNLIMPFSSESIDEYEIRKTLLNPSNLTIEGKESGILTHVLSFSVEMGKRLVNKLVR